MASLLRTTLALVVCWMEFKKREIEIYCRFHIMCNWFKIILKKLLPLYKIFLFLILQEKTSLNQCIVNTIKASAHLWQDWKGQYTHDKIARLLFYFHDVSKYDRPSENLFRKFNSLLVLARGRKLVMFPATTLSCTVCAQIPFLPTQDY